MILGKGAGYGEDTKSQHFAHLFRINSDKYKNILLFYEKKNNNYWMKKIKDIEEIGITGDTIPIRTKCREAERKFEGFK